MKKANLLMRFTRRGIGLLVALGAVAAIAAPAQAAPVEFAKFVFLTGSDFSFTNNGGTNGTLGSGTNTVQFSFTDANGNATQTFTATVAFSGTTTTPAGTVMGTVDQPINQSSSIVFTDTASGKNLLTVTYTGDLVGQVNTNNINLQSSSNVNTLTYSSAFLASTFFNNPQNFLINLPTDGSSAISVGPGGFLNSFIASNAQGQFFTSVATVPEPASLVMFGTGMAVTAVLAFRGRKRWARSAA